MGDLDNSATVQVTGKIMVVAIIILFVVVVFVLLLHLYAKWFWWRIEEPTHPPSRRSRSRSRRRFVFTPEQDPVRRGLELSVLRSLPVVIFQSEYFKDGLECAVCLSEIVQWEKARLLPKCNHGFHVDCIDMWFQSHSTCPLCRNSVAPQTESSIFYTNDMQENIQSPEEILASEYLSESPNFPTNLLFWGDQTQVSTGGGSGTGSQEGGASTQAPSSSSSSTSSSGSNRQDEMLVIDIPVQMNNNFAEEESKWPIPAQRLRSLKRLLSREKRVAPSSSGVSVDV